MYRSPKSRTVDLRTDAWALPDVRVLEGHVERFLGLGFGREPPVMLLTRSVHTFTMSGPLSIIVLDLDGAVVEAGTLYPRQFANFGTLRWVVEAEPDAPLPVPGSQIVASTMRNQCLEH